MFQTTLHDYSTEKLKRIHLKSIEIITERDEIEKRTIALEKEKQRIAAEEIERERKALQSFKDESTCRCHVSDKTEGLWYLRPFHPHSSNQECLDSLTNQIYENLDNVIMTVVPTFSCGDCEFFYTDIVCQEVCRNLMLQNIPNIHYVAGIYPLINLSSKSEVYLWKEYFTRYFIILTVTLLFAFNVIMPISLPFIIIPKLPIDRLPSDSCYSVGNGNPAWYARQYNDGHGNCKNGAALYFTIMASIIFVFFCIAFWYEMYIKYAHKFLVTKKVPFQRPDKMYIFEKDEITPTPTNQL